jgi:hypothetical protein
MRMTSLPACSTYSCWLVMACAPSAACSMLRVTFSSLCYTLKFSACSQLAQLLAPQLSNSVNWPQHTAHRITAPAFTAYMRTCPAGGCQIAPHQQT